MRQPKNVSLDNSGFTLIEVLIAMVILTVGLLGLLETINLAISQNLQTQLRNDAVIVADDFMMGARSLPFENISCSECPGTPHRYLVKRQSKSVMKNYSVVKTVTELSADQTKEIALEISWSAKNQRKSHSLSTIVAK
jgi:type IV pilus assembly protein PilV